MKFYLLLLALFAVLGALPAAIAEPSRNSGGNTGRDGPVRATPKQRPYYFDSPIKRPGQPTTMYA